MPGLINSHLHVTDTPFTQGFLEDIGDKGPAGSATNLVSLYSVLPEVRHAADPDTQIAAAECTFAELARTGSTTVAELGYDFEIGGNGDIAITERVADVAGRMGLRCYSGPRYRSRHYGLKHDSGVFYEDYPDKGLLEPDLIIGHGQVMSSDGDMNSMSAFEVAALRESQTTICHLPWVKARRGGVINSIQKYKDLGIRQSLGTDTFPFDLFNDMRMAAVVCKIVENAADAAPSEDVFAMATTGGADALGRPDPGRLAPGCRAYIVLVRIDTPKAAPRLRSVQVFGFDRHGR